MKDNEIVNVQVQECSKINNVSKQLEQINISKSTDTSLLEKKSDADLSLNNNSTLGVGPEDKQDSTKSSTTVTESSSMVENSSPQPVAPPRRKRKQKKEMKQVNWLLFFNI